MYGTDQQFAERIVDEIIGEYDLYELETDEEGKKILLPVSRLGLIDIVKDCLRA